MSDLATSAAPVPIKFLKEDGEEIEFRAEPLSDVAREELDKWAQMRTLERVAELNNPDLNREAIKTLLDISFFESDGGRTREGASRLIHAFIKKHHPQISVSDIMKLLLVPENKERTQLIMQFIYGVPSSNGNGQSTEKNLQEEST